MRWQTCFRINKLRVRLPTVRARRKNFEQSRNPAANTHAATVGRFKSCLPTTAPTDLQRVVPAASQLLAPPYKRSANHQLACPPVDRADVNQLRPDQGERVARMLRWPLVRRQLVPDMVAQPVRALQCVPRPVLAPPRAKPRRRGG